MTMRSIRAHAFGDSRSSAPRVHSRRLGLWMFAALGILLGLTPSASAQPFNVRAWYAKGQVFVIWEYPAAPVPTSTVQIYASPAAQVNIAFMQRVGQMFPAEYTGARLRALDPGAQLLVPTPAGGTYRLLANEGVFAYTPRAAGNLFFAVVDTGSVVVNAGNSAATAFAYNPVADPVRAHAQFVGATTQGYPYTAYVVWGEGRDDYENQRPDIPVFANFAKNGVPHVFTITRPLVAPLPGLLTCVFALHGGGGEYQLFRPGMPARANLSLPLTNGIVVTPDDNLYLNSGGALETRTTGWFGYVSNFDPFFIGARIAPPAGSVVVNFTQRRVFWILDWLNGPNSPFPINPQRVALIGHSNGARGASHLSRSAPERFCAVVAHTPPYDVAEDESPLDDFLRGEYIDNLATNLPDPAGGVLGIYDVLTATTRISLTTDDVPVSRHYFGKRDEESTASWEASMRAVLDDMNAHARGDMIFWDEREHGVEFWNTEVSDLTDDPAHTDPWPDIGQWIAPIRSNRASAQYVVDTYAANQTYPGFFNADEDAVLIGRQPDPGDGNPDNGAAYGTWGGYFDWDTATLVDTPTRWAATLFVTGLSAVSIDNALVSEIITDLIPRKTTSFKPAVGTCLVWTSTDIATGAVRETGLTIVDANGHAVVTGLNVPRDPARVRLTIDVCVEACNPADICGVGATYANGAVDIGPDGQLTIEDFLVFLSAFGDATGCPGIAPCNPADICGVGATYNAGTVDIGPDGQLTIEDFLNFLSAFGDATGCP